MSNDEVTRHVAYFDDEGYQLAPRPWVQDGADLIAFLRARLDEREARAGAAGAACWSIGTEETSDGENAYYSIGEYGEEPFVDADVTELAKFEHIADNDPAFVLEDVKVKRRILNECLKEVEREAGSGRRYPASTAWALAVTTLRLLALPYEEHPDYGERWRP